MTTRGLNVPPSPVEAGTRLVLSELVARADGRYFDTWVGTVRSMKRVTGGWQIMVERHRHQPRMVFTWFDDGHFGGQVYAVRVMPG